MTQHIELKEYEHLPEYYIKDLNEVKSLGLEESLKKSLEDNFHHLSALNLQEWGFIYAPGKWSIEQVIKHVVEIELEFQESFLQDLKSEVGISREIYFTLEQDIQEIQERLWGDSILEDLQKVRIVTMDLLHQFEEDFFDKPGSMFGVFMSNKVKAFLVAGHNASHMRIIKERYLSRLS